MLKIDQKTLSLIIYTILMGRMYQDSCPRWTAIGARWGRIRLEVRFYHTGMAKVLAYSEAKQLKGKLLDITL
jgi:hypothetical protein